MAKLDSLITNTLTGEAISYYGSTNKVLAKQVFEVTKKSNYTWEVKSSLYLKLDSNYPSESGERFAYGIWQRIQSEYFKLEQDIQLLSLSGHWVNGVQVSNNAYEYYKVMENTKIIDCSNTGRKGILLDCGYINSSSSTRYFTDYTLIYLTLPSFSGMRYKLNGSYKSVMPWKKINGEWKRVNQYIKINGTWKEQKDTWIWNPET